MIGLITDHTLDLFKNLDIYIWNAKPDKATVFYVQTNSRFINIHDGSL